MAIRNITETIENKAKLVRCDINYLLKRKEMLHMKTKDVVKILYCLTLCNEKQNCEVFSPCIGSRTCLIPALNECEQLDKCLRIKRIVKSILRCKTLAEIYNTEGGDDNE